MIKQQTKQLIKQYTKASRKHPAKQHITKFLKSPFSTGAFFLMCYAIFSSLNDVCMKLTTTNEIDTLFLRHLSANIFLLPFIIKSRPKITLQRTRNHLVRAIIFAMSMLCYISALKQLPLAVVVAINFSIPLFVVLFACTLLGEKWRGRMLSVAIGFAGILIVCAHSLIGASSNYTHILIMLLATILFALLDIFNKYLLNHDEPLTIMLFASNLFITLFCLPFFSYTIPANLALFAYLGLGANLVLYFLLRAWNSCDISALQPIKYVEFPLALLFGSIVFQDSTHITTIIGVLIMFGGIVMNIIYEWKQK